MAHNKRFKLERTAEALPVQQVKVDESAKTFRHQRKPWAVEYRTRPAALDMAWGCFNKIDRTVWRKYTTRRARDEALAQIERRIAKEDRWWPWRDCEFRPKGG